MLRGWIIVGRWIIQNNVGISGVRLEACTDSDRALSTPIVRCLGVVYRAVEFVQNHDHLWKQSISEGLLINMYCILYVILYMYTNVYCTVWNILFFLDLSLRYWQGIFLQVTFWFFLCLRKVRRMWNRFKHNIRVL